ncbi:unnamed protein product, partial [Polarella glacialis]
QLSDNTAPVSGKASADAWEFLAGVVPLCSGVTLLFLQELRSMQRALEQHGEQGIADFLLSQPHISRTAVGDGKGAGVSIEDLCDGSWMARVPAQMSMAWLQVDRERQVLQITRLLDGAGRGAGIISHRVELSSGVLRRVEEELRSIHEKNCGKIREHLQRPDSGLAASRAEFWKGRKVFDGQLGCLAKRIQNEVLGTWRFLLSPWPKSQEEARELLRSLEAWLKSEASSLAAGNFSFPQPPLAEDVAAGSPCVPGCSSSEQGRCGQTSEASRFWLLALLFLEADKLEVPQIVSVLTEVVTTLQPGADQRPLTRSRLQRTASSLQRLRLETRKASGSLVADAPLLLFVDSVMAQLPLEACPCLAQREVVRAVAPNVTLSSLARFQGRSHPSSGFYVIDSLEDGARPISSVKDLVAGYSASSGGSGRWHGRVGKPMPEGSEVLGKLRESDVFVYLGHGEAARQLLRQETLQLGGPGALASTTPFSSGLEFVVVVVVVVVVIVVVVVVVVFGI